MHYRQRRSDINHMEPGRGGADSLCIVHDHTVQHQEYFGPMGENNIFNVS